MIDDDVDTANIFAESLRLRGYDARPVYSAAEAIAELSTRRIDLIVTDVGMPDMNGIELTELLRREHPEIMSIVVTGKSSMDSAVAAMRAGAWDYIPKPLNAETLAIAMQRAMLHLSLRRELAHLRDAHPSARSQIAGSSSAIVGMLDLVERVSAGDATVLITGESGTGKELVARALHERSPRATEPFVAINCGAMPAPLLESELFGHVRGAFTDAKQSRPGLFAQAGAGTIFLDEIGEMPLEMQVKLLRVLQERRVRPVGGDTEVDVRARVVAATNRDLDREVAEKRFREDLYYRINVVPVHVPPLRDRPGDVLLLAQHFLVRAAKRTGKRVEAISPPVARKLLDYDWPGNVRELENAIERAVALARLSEITLEDMPARVVEHGTTAQALAADASNDLVTIDEMQRRYARVVLQHARGNKTHAAKILGIDRRSLYRRLQPVKGAESAVANDDSTTTH